MVLSCWRRNWTCRCERRGKRRKRCNASCPMPHEKSFPAVKRKKISRRSIALRRLPHRSRSADSRLQPFATRLCQGCVVSRVAPQLVANQDAGPKNHQRTVENQNAPCPFTVNSTLLGAIIIWHSKHAWLLIKKKRRVISRA